MPHFAPPLAPVPLASVRACSARVKYANTPESDLQLRVMHLVTLSDGSVVEVSATDPMNAIDIANARLPRLAFC